MKISHPLELSKIVALIDGELIGDSSMSIHKLQKIEDAVDGDLSFLASSKFERFLETSSASCLLVSRTQNIPTAHAAKSFIRCDHPHKAFLQIIDYLQKHHSIGSAATSGVHASVVIGTDCSIAQSARIDAGTVIADRVMIAENVHIAANVVIGSDSSIGEDSIVYPNVTIYEETVIGRHCILHANSVIGSDGFGYLENSDGSFEKIPQIGNVVLEDNVEIGAGACIDRAALGSTVLHKGVKIDNLVHIAHNVEIEEHSAVAALSGIAGGTHLGKRNRLAGQVGVVGYVRTSDDVTIGAQSGVSKNLSTPGVYSGSPAVELRQRLRQEAAIRRLAQ